MARTLSWIASFTDQTIMLVGAKIKSIVFPSRLSPLQHQLLDFSKDKPSQFEIGQSQLSQLSKLSSSEVRARFERGEFKTEAVQREAIQRLDLGDAEELLASRIIRNPYMCFELERHTGDLKSAGRASDSA